ncbi:unnamed protein product [Owenia fusiformis]|uniref:Uncharacterized protein n=1 Tax=Owenia fusiformis TaxID=6347 RepID=A0A8S4NY62_OWEFU|nr:unnamed protein product [Owenia fusiformis]
MNLQNLQEKLSIRCQGHLGILVVFLTIVIMGTNSLPVSSLKQTVKNVEKHHQVVYDRDTNAKRRQGDHFKYQPRDEMNTAIESVLDIMPLPVTSRRTKPQSGHVPFPPHRRPIATGHPVHTAHPVHPSHPVHTDHPVHGGDDDVSTTVAMRTSKDPKRLSPNPTTTETTRTTTEAIISLPNRTVDLGNNTSIILYILPATTPMPRNDTLPSNITDDNKRQFWLNQSLVMFRKFYAVVKVGFSLENKNRNLTNALKNTTASFINLTAEDYRHIPGLEHDDDLYDQLKIEQHRNMSAEYMRTLFWKLYDTTQNGLTSDGIALFNAQPTTIEDLAYHCCPFG